MKFVFSLFVFAMVAAEISGIPLQGTEFFGNEGALEPLEDIQRALKHMKYAASDLEVTENQLKMLSENSNQIGDAKQALMAAVETTENGNRFIHASSD